jgi:hypothetical protein
LSTRRISLSPTLCERNAYVPELCCDHGARAAAAGSTGENLRASASEAGDVSVEGRGAAVLLDTAGGRRITVFRDRLESGLLQVFLVCSP